MCLGQVQPTEKAPAVETTVEEDADMGVVEVVDAEDAAAED